MSIRTRIAEALEDVAGYAGKFKGRKALTFIENNARDIDPIIAKVERIGLATLSQGEMNSLSDFYKGFRAAQKRDGVADNMALGHMNSVMRPLFKDQEAYKEFGRFMMKAYKDDANLAHVSATVGNRAKPPARFEHFVASEAVQDSISDGLSVFRGDKIFAFESKAAFQQEFDKFEKMLRDNKMLVRRTDELGRRPLSNFQDVAEALRDGRKVTEDEFDLIGKAHGQRLDAHLKNTNNSPSNSGGGMMGGNRGPSPATQAALADHENFRKFAVDRLGAFGVANKLFEAGSSQILVQNFAKLDEMVGAFSVKHMGNSGAAKVDALGNLENPEVLFASMIPDAGVKPQGAPISLTSASKADPTDVNGKILSYYDNEGKPITPLITADHASPNDVNRVLQQLLSYKPGTEVHIHPADWEKVRGAVYDRRFNELSNKFTGGQKLDATPGTGAAGKDSPQSELDDWATAARITGRVVQDSNGASRRSVNDIVADALGTNGKISEADIDAIRRSHTAARAAENNPTSNVVRDIVDTLKPTTKEVAEVQDEMAKLRTNVRAAGMLDTTPVDPHVPARSLDEIKEALRNGEQVKTPELERYISKQIGDSLLSSQQSLVSALQTGFKANKRMDTEQIFAQLEKIRKDPDYPLRVADEDGKVASPKNINKRLFRGEPISDGELTVLRSFYKRHFDTNSAPVDSGGGGMGIKALQLAQSITDGIKDSKSAATGSLSRAAHYNTGVPIPSIRRSIIPIVGAGTLGALGQAALDPEEPNFVGRAAINFVYPDGNPNASDFAEFTYNRMNSSTSMARGYFKKYLGIDIPQDAPAGQTKTPEQVEADKQLYINAIQKIRARDFVKDPTPDLRQALMMYASVKATGTVSTSSAEAQAEINKNVDAEAGAVTSNQNKAAVDGANAPPPAGPIYQFGAPGGNSAPSVPDTTGQVIDLSQAWDRILAANISLDTNQRGHFANAFNKIAKDDGLTENERSDLEKELNKGIPAPIVSNIMQTLSAAP